MLRLAEKAFYPARIPFPVHARRHRPQLPRGARVPRPPGRRARGQPRRRHRSRTRSTPARSSSRRTAPATASRPRCCWTPSRSTASPRSSAGARRDEDKARAKERVFSFRDEFGQWDPKNQRPELWSLYNGRIHPGESIRVFPLSNWTELDIWHYIARERIDLPSIYFAHDREVVDRDGMLYAVNEFIRPAAEARRCRERRVRYRTVGDASLTAAVRSDADTVEKVIDEVAATRITERGRHARRRQVQRGRHGGPQAGGVLLMDMLRFATAGSVDDGKSTLIGRLLYDTKTVFAGPDRRRRAGQPGAGRGATPTSRCSPTGCGPSGSRASPSTSRTATSPPPGGSSSSPTPRGTSSTPATWSPAPPRPTWRWCSSTPARAWSSRAAGTRSWRRCSQVPHLVLVRQQDGPGRTTPQEVFEQIRDEFTGVRDASCGCPTCTVIPVSALHGDNVVNRSANMPWYERPDAAAPPGERAHRQRPQPDRRPVPGAVRHPPPVRRTATTTAATPVRSRAAC